jgi:AbrB family looped-hinge helix DNA binding protein
MSEATLTSKGQITLPKQIRNALNLKPGDRLSFILEKGKKVRMEAQTLSVSDIKGILKPPSSTPVSISKMNQAIKKRGAGR